MAEPEAGRTTRPGGRRLPLHELPAGWRVVETAGPWPFVSWALLERPDGSRVEWTSRRHRKKMGLSTGTGAAPVGTEAPAAAPPPGGARHRPSPTSWWIGSLFMIGSFCFALGSIPLYFDNVDGHLVAMTFFVGSIFFTSAAYLQYQEAQGAPTGPSPEARPPRGLRRFLGVEPRRIDWWATAIQFVGTISFNVTTFAATRTDLTLSQEKRLIWVPDVFGSICFLVASWLAYREVAPHLRLHRPRGLGWWISALNLLGSVAFGVAAVASRYLSTTGEPANITLVNLGTLLGAVCFFVGAALLPVESARETVDP